MLAPVDFLSFVLSCLCIVLCAWVVLALYWKSSLRFIFPRLRWLLCNKVCEWCWSTNWGIFLFSSSVNNRSQAPPASLTRGGKLSFWLESLDAKKIIKNGLRWWEHHEVPNIYVECIWSQGWKAGAWGRWRSRKPWNISWNFSLFWDFILSPLKNGSAICNIKIWIWVTFLAFNFLYSFGFCVLENTLA